MANQTPSKTVELKTRHLILLCLAAGMSFTDWYALILNTLSALSDQIGHVITWIAWQLGGSK